MILCFATLFMLISLNTAQPTTPHIQSIFTGKCYEKNPENTNCTELWATFALGAEMDMTRVTNADFDPFFTIANFSSSPNNALFWSGNKGFANRLSQDGTRFTTLEETSTGFVLNGLSWCGNPYENGTSPSFDYINSCNYSQSPGYFGSQGVWNRCSQGFAAGVSGAITILLQPQYLYYDHGPILAYRNTSIFAVIELPSMHPQQITQVTILLLANKTLASEEVCGSGSLKELQAAIVNQLKIEPSCVDDPEKIIGILCDNGNESTPECMAAYMTAHETPDTKQNDRGILVWAIIGTSVSSVLLLAVIVLAYNLSKIKKQGQYFPVRG